MQLVPNAPPWPTQPSFVTLRPSEYPPMPAGRDEVASTSRTVSSLRMRTPLSPTPPFMIMR